MKDGRLKKYSVLIIISCWLISSAALADAIDPGLLSAKKEAEAKGLIFVTSHDEIVAQARKEGKMHAVLSLQPATIKGLRVEFKKQYPFLDVTIEETTGTAANRRLILEVKAGRMTGKDAVHLPNDMYQEYLPFMNKFDLIGMAKHGVLSIPNEGIDKANPYVMSVTYIMQVSAYNKNLLSGDQLPKTWEDFLKPQFKGKKFVADIRPTEIAALVPAWGLDRVIDFARKIAAQEPVWARGGTRTLTAMTVGEYALFMGPNYHTAMRVIGKDPRHSLDIIIMEPVPVRPSQHVGVLTQSRNPHAALLLMEFLVSSKGQQILDEGEPYAASVFTPGSALNKVAKGKQLSLSTWEDIQHMQEFEKKVIEAYGFPRAEIKRKRK